MPEEIISLTEKAITEGIQRFVVGAIVINKKKEILILKRASNDFMAGIYELPSGKVEEGESLLEALKREILEETGLKMKEVLKFVDYFDYVSGSGKNTRQFNFLVNVEDDSNIVLSEHESFAQVKRENLSEFNLSKEVRRAIKKCIIMLKCPNLS